MSESDGPPGRRGRGRPRSAQAGRAITQAAWALLRDGGARRFSLERVAERAGVAVTTVYRRYPRADDLLLALNEQVYAEVDVPDLGSVRADLDVMMAAIVEAWAPPQRRRGLLVAMIAAQEDNAGLAEVYAEQLRRRRVLTTRIVDRGIERGEVDPDVDPHLVMELLAGLVLQRLVVARKVFSSEDAAAVVDLVVRGIAPRG